MAEIIRISRRLPVNFNRNRTRIIEQLISSEENDSLPPHPYFTCFDMYIICRVLKWGDGKMILNTVTDLEYAYWDMYFPDLIRVAASNMDGWYRSTKEEIIGSRDMPKYNVRKGDMLGYVLSNEKKTIGATSLIYTGMTEDLSERMGGDYYAVPSDYDLAIILDKRLSREAVLALSEMVLHRKKRKLHPLSRCVLRYDVTERRLKDTGWRTDGTIEAVSSDD